MRNRWLGEDPNDLLEIEAEREAELANAQAEVAWIEEMEEMFASDAWGYYMNDLRNKIDLAKTEAVGPDATIEKVCTERGTIRAFQYSLARPDVLATRKRHLLERLKELGESQ